MIVDEFSIHIDDPAGTLTSPLLGLLSFTPLGLQGLLSSPAPELVVTRKCVLPMILLAGPPL